jgi:AhpD family alkylhydroperoxidase
MEESDNKPYKKLLSKGVDLGDRLLESARLLTSRGIFSNSTYLSELLIYASAVVQGCEVCALTHIDGAVRARVPQEYVATVNTIALYIHSQADDETRLLFETYQAQWQRYEEWPHISSDRVANRKFYNLVALLMGLVVRKRRLVHFHAYELLTKTDVTPAEVLEIAGVAQVMGGFPARWEMKHFFDTLLKLRRENKLPDIWESVFETIPDVLVPQ